MPYPPPTPIPFIATPYPYPIVQTLPGRVDLMLLVWLALIALCIILIRLVLSWQQRRTERGLSPLTWEKRLIRWFKRRMNVPLARAAKPLKWLLARFARPSTPPNLLPRVSPPIAADFNRQPPRPLQRLLARLIPLLEIAAILLTVYSYCSPFLDMGSSNRLPGNESEVFQLLDWTLVHSIREFGAFPLWNPYIRDGLPYVADPMFHAFNPVVSLPVLLWGVADGFKIAVFLSFLLGALGMRRLGVALGVGPLLRVWMALMFVFAGQPTARFFQGQYLFIFGFAWIPWVIAGFFRTLETRRLRDLALTALALALLFFSGNAYYAFYMVFAAALFALVHGISLKPLAFNPRPLVIVAAVGLLAMGLAAAQLLPTAEFWPRIGKSLDLAGSHTPAQIFLDFTSTDSFRPDAYQKMPAREEFYAYIGLWPFLALALLPLAFLQGDKRPLIFFLLLLLVVILWIDLNEMPWQQWFLETRLVLQFRHLLRFLVYGSFAILTLAALGLDTAWKLLWGRLGEAARRSPEINLRATGQRQMNPAEPTAGRKAGFIQRHFLARTFMSGRADAGDAPGQAGEDNARARAGAESTPDAAATQQPTGTSPQSSENQHAAPRRARSRIFQNILTFSAAAVLLGFLLAAVLNLYLINRPILHTQPIQAGQYAIAGWLKEQDPGYVLVRGNPANGWHDALISQGLRFSEGWYHFDDIRQHPYDSAHRPVNAHPNYIIQPSAEAAPPYPFETLEHPFSETTIYRLPQSLPFAFAVRDEVLNQGAAAGELARSDVTTLDFVIPSPNAVELNVPSGGGETLALLYTHFPGWQVSVDGRPASLLSVDGFLGVALVEGVHTYTFTFRPISFYTGLWVSGIALLAAALMLATGVKQDWERAKLWGKTALGALGGVQNRLTPRRLSPRLAGFAVVRQGALHPEERLLLPEETRLHLWAEDAATFDRPRAALARWGRATAELAGSLTRGRSLAVTLFLVALVVYAATRLIGLERFPITFYTDEAIQTESAAWLVSNDYRDAEGILLPTYFQNGPYYNLSASVYLQLVPYLLFGKSAAVTRGVSALISVFAAAAVGLMLQQTFKLRYGWAGVLILAFTPAWFLHARTAFETAEFVSFYALFLYCYLRYRNGAPRFLYAALVFAALAFYAYSPGRMVLVVTGVLLLLSDLPYHWKNRRMALGVILLTALLAAPFVRFTIQHPTAMSDQLRDLGSYWMQPGETSEKALRFVKEYLYGLSPAYWFSPGAEGLERHRLDGYGNLLLIAAPFMALGLLISLWNIRKPEYRALLIALLAAPSGSALVGVGITRVLVMVIPAAALTVVGLSRLLEWLQRLLPRLNERWLALSLGAALSLGSLGMLNYALVYGAYGYSEYGLFGVQYGSFQIFDEIERVLRENPETHVICSPGWANGTDVIARFFLGDNPAVELGSIEGHIYQLKPLDDNMLFVMTPVEYQKAQESGKFTDFRIEKTIPYPNGQPGFYFVRLRYVDNIEALLEVDRQARLQLQEGEINIGGAPISVKYSTLDMGSITEMFDGNPNTVARTFEANPLVIVLTFQQPQEMSGLSLIIGTTTARITARLYPDPGADPIEESETLTGTLEEPKVTLNFTQPVTASVLWLEIYDLYQPEPAHIHIWEIEVLR